MSAAAKLCDCGCGGVAPISDRTDHVHGYVRGQPHRYIRGHGSRGELSRRWKGGRRVNAQGYVEVRMPEHPRARANGYVFEHILIAEAALGGSLPDGVEIHHFNEVKSDNRPQNLIICPDKAYHGLLHQRQRAYEACAHADWRKCRYCGRFDSPESLSFSGRDAFHRRCAADNRRRRVSANGRR